MVESESEVLVSGLEIEVFNRLNAFRALSESDLVMIPELYKEASQISYNVGKKLGNRFRINSHFPYAKYAILYHDIIMADSEPKDLVYNAIINNSQIAEKIKDEKITNTGISIRPMKKGKICFCIILMEFNIEALQEAFLKELQKEDKRRYTIESLLDHINVIREKLILLPYRQYPGFMEYVEKAKSPEELEELAKKHDGRYLIVKVNEGGTIITILKKLIDIVSFLQFIISVQASLGIKFHHQKGYLVITLFAGFTNNESKVTRPDNTEITFTGEFYPYEKEKLKDSPLKRTIKTPSQSPMNENTPKIQESPKVKTPKTKSSSPETPKNSTRKTPQTQTPRSQKANKFEDYVSNSTPVSTPKQNANSTPKPNTPKSTSKSTPRPTKADSGKEKENKWATYRSDSPKKSPKVNTSSYRPSNDPAPHQKAVATLSPRNSSPRMNAMPLSTAELEHLALNWINKCRLTTLSEGPYSTALTPFDLIIPAGTTSEVRERLMASPDFKLIVAEPGSIAFISAELKDNKFRLQICIGFESASEQVTYEVREYLKARGLQLMEEIENFANQGVSLMYDTGKISYMDDVQRSILSKINGYQWADSIILPLQSEVHLAKTVEKILKEKFEETLQKYNNFNVYVKVGEENSLVGIFLIKVA